MPAPEMSPDKYEELLKQELEKLQTVLLEQHRKEVAKQIDLTFAMAKNDLKGLPSSREENAGIRMVKDDDSVSEDTVLEVDFGMNSPGFRWHNFTQRLLSGEANSQLEEVTSEVQEEDLNLRPAWNISWQEASNQHRSRSDLPLRRRTTHSLRMNEVIRDSSCVGRLVLPPRSKPQMTWTFLGSLFILWDLITIPLEFFQLSDSAGIFTIMGRISMVFWMMDMPANLFFGVEIQGKTEMRVKELARIYFRSYFFLDLLVVSIDVAILCVEFFGEETAEGFRSARFLRTMRLLRLLRLLRAVKLQQELTLLANRFLSVHVFMVAKVVMGLIMMLLVNHIIACLWYGIGSWIQLETGNSWIERSQMTEAGFAESYAASMHWTLTQFTPATNDIAPNSAFERLFAVWVILLAMGVFSSFISSITATVSSLRASQAKQFQERASLLRFFCERNLSADLYGKVEEVLRKEGMFRVRIQEKEVELVKGIPETLLQQLHEEMYMSMLHHLAFWPSWSLTQDHHFLLTLCHFCMVEHIAKPMQDAFLPGRLCPEVYIVETGRLCYVPGGKGEMIISEGEVLCLPSLWAEWKYKGRLVASFGSAYYVGLCSIKFCEVASEHGGPLWQYLQILGILLLGLVEASSTRSDFILPHLIPELSSRASKYAEILNNRLAHRSAYSRSNSRSKESLHSDTFRPVLETMETFEQFTTTSKGLSKGDM
eukprot:symbB.v1.2.014995.t1/scaffold1092.1/size138572/6